MNKLKGVDFAYLLIPITVRKPRASGWYNCYAGDEFLGNDWYDIGEEKFKHKPVTHWLERLPIEEFLGNGKPKSDWRSVASTLWGGFEFIIAISVSIYLFLFLLVGGDFHLSIRWENVTRFWNIITSYF